MAFSLETHMADADLFQCEVNEDRITGFVDTVVHSVSDGGESVQLGDVFDEDHLEEGRRVWGLDEADLEVFDQMDEGDVVLFTHFDAVIGIAVISTTAKSEKLGVELWSEPSISQLLLFRELIPASFPASNLYEELGHTNGPRLSETQRINQEAKKTLLESYNNLAEFAETASTSRETSINELLALYRENPPSCVWLNETEFESTLPEAVGLEQGCIFCLRSSDGGEELALLEEGDLLVQHNSRHGFSGYSVVTASHSVHVDGSKGVLLWFAYTSFVNTYRPADYASLLLDLDIDLRHIPLVYQIKQGRVHSTPWKSVKILLEDIVENQAEQFLENRCNKTIDEIDFDLSGEPLYFPEEEANLQQQINSTLAAGKHIIFTGPPGTGKTQLARAICEYASNTAFSETVDDYQFTTASADWTSFDTVGGYSPSKTDNILEFQPGQFLKSFRDGEDLRNWWLLIDELNRADIDKAIGGLFSVLTGEEVELPYENREPIRVTPLSAGEDRHFGRTLAEIARSIDTYPVLPSWRLIATMNTSDKASLYELSYAFTRRFNFIHIGVPDLKKGDRFVTEHLDSTTDDSYTISLDDNETRMLASGTLQAELSVLWGRVNKYRTLGPSIILDIIQYIYQSVGYELEDLSEPSDDNDTRTDLEEGSEEAPESENDTGEIEIESNSRSPAELYQGPLTDAITMLIFPQLDGLREDNLMELIRRLDEGAETVDGEQVTVHLDTQRLYRKAENFYGITIDE